MTDPVAWPVGADVAAWRLGDDDEAALDAVGAIVDYCKWHIFPVITEDVTVDGSGLYIQRLPTMRLLEVNSLTELPPFGNDCGEDPGTPVALVDGTDYEWSEIGILKRITWTSGIWWTDRLRGIAANITHGYADLPRGVRAVALSLAARATASPSGDVREQRGPFAVSHAETTPGQAGGMDLTELQKSALRAYRIPGAP